MQGDALGQSGRYKLKEGDTYHELSYTEEEKDLGVVIDGKLDFDRHINIKINKASSIMAVIRRSFVSLNGVNFVPLYKVPFKCCVTRMGGGGVSFPGKKRYEGVRFNVISVTRGWVGVKFPGKKRYVTLEWPPRA